MPRLEDLTDLPSSAPTPNQPEGVDRNFEKVAEQAETEAALERDLEGTFPTSDPPSSWAGSDLEAERSRRGSTSLAQGTSSSPKEKTR